MIYIKFSDLKVESNETGRQQFFNYESFGIYPENPDPFFICLQQGKKWFSVEQENIRNSYLTREWYGWYGYWDDWKGERWMLKYLMSWHPDPPEWIFSEDSHE